MCGGPGPIMIGPAARLMSRAEGSAHVQPDDAGAAQ